ncbi:DUF349 domain-containing protein [Psychroserpens sp. XS_ASV72]|uniref:DUF349 domain-containing protein n=1 Tax=Psychroserpens sp. XS_ASV72 TaxID=3241293 RepID=UPI003511817A
MSELDNLQNADGKKEMETENVSATENNQDADNATSEVTETTVENENSTDTEVTSSETKTEEIDNTSDEVKEDITEENTTEAEEKKDAHVDEIDEANAEDAEDESNVERHTLESKDYHAMSMDALVKEFDALLNQHKVQNIRSQVSDIKSEFKSKFDELLEEKKEEFINDGGNEIDFHFSTPTRKQFNDLYKTYRNNLNSYYKNREASLKENLEKRLAIIEEIKGLINVEENINTTYNHFKELQEQWRNAGPIPRDKYNNAWNSYHHHVEIFYDFLHLNRDLRDMDFKHNLEKKTKIIEQAEELAKDDNVNRAFRELQVLHKLWKEELGPVAKEHREEIWERFSTATKAIHDKRQAYYADLDKAYEVNLEKKEEIIGKIDAIAQDQPKNHQGWQKQIKEVESLRQDFFNAGKVPLKANEATWTKFKTTVRAFNRNKNAYYKNLKKSQYDNLKKKQELIKIAEDNKDSEDFEATTPLMKKIQSDWKTIGHVPRKDSDKIWKQFKKACNHYFDRLHAERNAANEEEMEAFQKKSELLDGVKALSLSGKPKEDIETIKDQINSWKALGSVPRNKRFIEKKFHTAIDELFNKLDMDKAKLEMIKFENKLETLAKPEDTSLLDNEQNFIRKKIKDIKGEINQLENNMQFFTNVDESNPLVKEVIKNVKKHKDELQVWKDKLKKVKSMY